MIPFITSRTSTWRLLPPRLAGGINGSTCAHSSSVRSLGYRSTLRSYRLRFFAVHIGDPSSNQATTLESQMIHWIQFVFGRTLRAVRPPQTGSAGVLFSTPRWHPTPTTVDTADHFVACHICPKISS